MRTTQVWERPGTRERPVEPEDVSPRLGQEFAASLAGWHRARNDSRRYDRNLLQLGAAIAAILGISAGSGGVFAIANGVSGRDDLPQWAAMQLLALTAFAVVVGGIFALLAIWTYFKRGAAEREAERNLINLFMLDPERAAKLEG